MRRNAAQGNACRRRLVLAGLGAIAVLLGGAPVRAEEPGSVEQPARDDSEQEDAEAASDEPPADAGEVILIEDKAPYVPVAERSVRDRDFLLRPHPRPADVLRVVPGMFVTQHAGGGKANQYFLRGFDADHGTDVALSFDGVPLNLVSHGHGQGYTDLNWVIPELVKRLDIFKGPYSTEIGDFATAGAMDMVTHERLEESSVSVTAGRFGTYRALAIASPRSTLGFEPLFAAEAYAADGPFENEEDYARYSLFGKARRDLSARSSISLAATSYAGDWNGSGQVPLRAVESGEIPRFGSLDPTEGGRSQRHSLYGVYSRYPDDRSELRVLAYLVRSRLNIFSNFTFFSEDPVMGDQIEQVDDRYYGGVDARYRLRSDWGETPLETTFFVQARGDLIDNALHHTRERERLETRNSAAVREGSVGIGVQEDIEWTPELRTVVGARLDVFGFDVDDHIDPEMSSGRRAAALLSPKASLVYSPRERLDLFVNAGLGFHSNDARAVVRRGEAGTPLAGAFGYELGARTRLADRFDLAGSLWGLDLESEVVWSGDAGTTEARGPTRRLGAELEARAEILPWLFADLDVTVSRARFVDRPAGEDRVPLAPRFTLSGGLAARHPEGVFGRLGARSLSDRPLTEDGFLTAEGFTLLDLTLGYRRGRYEVSLAVDNLTDTRWREAQFATASRLASDPSTMAPPPSGTCPSGTRAVTEDARFAGCEDVHFTPGYPLNAMLTMKTRF